MHTKLAFVALATLSTLVPAVVGKGEAKIVNRCSEPIFIWSIADEAGEKMVELQPSDSYKEEYRENPNGGGVSIKISADKNQKEVSQFEYTVADKESKVYYDLSNIDGYPFVHGGINLIPSDDSCPKIECPAGVKKCEQAYNVWNDDHATKGCPIESDLEMVICASGDKPNAKKGKLHVRPRHPHARPEA
ncbi:hypothetical protein FQN57_003158 [Myotisia sp. PD_48]|nr:hypothetical protein FQN57_003158 [Myotisia sp. PD_48]